MKKLIVCYYLIFLTNSMLIKLIRTLSYNLTKIDRVVEDSEEMEEVKDLLGVIEVRGDSGEEGLEKMILEIILGHQSITEDTTEVKVDMTDKEGTTSDHRDRVITTTDNPTTEIFRLFTREHMSIDQQVSVSHIKDQ